MSGSPDGKFLVSLGSGSPCRVWDVESSAVVASLPKENVSNPYLSCENNWLCRSLPGISIQEILVTIGTLHGRSSKKGITTTIWLIIGTLGPVLCMCPPDLDFTKWLEI